MDHCCGRMMVAQLRSVYTEGGSVIHDVPFLTCPTCGEAVIAQDVDFDFTMYAHHCETDGLKVGSLADAIGKERIRSLLEKFPPDERVRTGVRVLPDQIDALLDLLNVARASGDDAWAQEILSRLAALHQRMAGQRVRDNRP